jgi:hypothetical protein
MTALLDRVLNRATAMGIRAADAAGVLSLVDGLVRCRAGADYRRALRRAPSPNPTGYTKPLLSPTARASSLRAMAACLCWDRFSTERWQQRLFRDGPGWQCFSAEGAAVISFVHTCPFTLLVTVLRGTGRPVAMWRGHMPWLLGPCFQHVADRADHIAGISGTRRWLRIKDGVRTVVQHLHSGLPVLMAFDGGVGESRLAIPFSEGVLHAKDGPLRLARNAACGLYVAHAIETMPFQFRLSLSERLDPASVESIRSHVSGILDDLWSRKLDQLDTALLQAVEVRDAKSPSTC